MLAASIITAGVSQGLDGSVFQHVELGTTSSTFEKLAQKLLTNAVRGTIRGAISATINGGDVEEALKNNLVYAAVDTLGAFAATEIGAAYHAGDIPKAAQLIAHAALGCATGLATSGNGQGCAGGAVGAVTGEWVGEALFEHLKTDINVWLESNAEPTREELVAFKQRYEGIVDFSRLSAGLAAFAVAGDVYAGADAGENAADNNAGGAIAIPLALAAGKICSKNKTCRKLVIAKAAALWDYIVHSEETEDEGTSEDNVPDLPEVLVGEQDDKAGKAGDRHISGPLTPEQGGTGDAEADFDKLTGGRSVEGTGSKEGFKVGENGVILRPAKGTSGPRIDIPAKG